MPDLETHSYNSVGARENRGGDDNDDEENETETSPGTLEMGARLRIVDAGTTARSSPNKHRPGDEDPLSETVTPAASALGTTNFWVEEPQDATPLATPNHSGRGGITHEDDEESLINLDLVLNAQRRGQKYTGQGDRNDGASSSRGGGGGAPHGVNDVEELVLNGVGTGTSPGSRPGTALWKIAQNRMSSVAAFQQKAIKKPRRGGIEGTADGGFDGFDTAEKMDPNIEAWLRQTVNRMPVTPDHVSGVRGPLMNVSQVDESTVDVVMTTSFRAHFSQPIRNLGPGDTTGMHELPETDGDGYKANGKGQLRELLSPGGGGMREAFSSKYENDAGAEVRVKNRDGAMVALGNRGGGMIPGSNGRFGIMSPDDYVDDGKQDAGVGHARAVAVRDRGGGTTGAHTLDGALVPRADVGLLHMMREWEMQPADVRLHERLAVGGFAEVFRGTWNGTTVAVKQLLERGPDVAVRLREEVVVLGRLRHPNLLLFMGWCPDPPLIATEFMRRGSLHSILRRNGGPFGGPRMHHAATSVARGMHYLHSRTPPILHLDLKSPNILLDDKWRVKIADFGLARVRRNTLLSGRSNFHGTPEWMAPEMLRAESYDEKADVYSYGVVLWELLTAQTPWNDLHPMQVVAVVGFSERRLTLPAEAQEVVNTDAATRVIGDLFIECASKDPGDRPTFTDCLGRLERALMLMLPAPSRSTNGIEAGGGGRLVGGGRGHVCGAPKMLPSPEKAETSEAPLQGAVTLAESAGEANTDADHGDSGVPGPTTGRAAGGVIIEEIHIQPERGGEEDEEVTVRRMGMELQEDPESEQLTEGVVTQEE